MANDAAWGIAQRALENDEGEVSDPKASRFEHLPREEISAEDFPKGVPPEVPKSKRDLINKGLAGAGKRFSV
jgi:hypothetical protein